MSSFYNNAGARIRRLREINRYTREDLAELADISPKFLYEIETGQKGFSADTLHRITQALCVSSEYILTGDNKEEYSQEVLGILKLFSDSQLKTVSQMLKLMYEMNTKS